MAGGRDAGEIDVKIFAGVDDGREVDVSAEVEILGNFGCRESAIVNGEEAQDTGPTVRRQLEPGGGQEGIPGGEIAFNDPAARLPAVHEDAKKRLLEGGCHMSELAAGERTAGEGLAATVGFGGGGAGRGDADASDLGERQEQAIGGAEGDQPRQAAAIESGGLDPGFHSELVGNPDFDVRGARGEASPG